jgi:hypothetical protein
MPFSVERARNNGRLGHRIGHRSEHDRYGAIHLSQRRDVVVGLREDHVGHKRRQFGADTGLAIGDPGRRRK